MRRQDTWENSYYEMIHTHKTKKGGTTLRTLTLARGLIGVIHATRKQVEIVKALLRVLAVNLAFDLELEGHVPKRRC